MGGGVYRLAADPAQDEKFRQQAAKAYDRLWQRCKAREVEPIDSLGDEAVPDGTTVGWAVMALEPRLNVVLRPLPEGSRTSGKYNQAIANMSAIITLYNGDWEDYFWQSNEDYQLKMLSQAFPRRTFLHEYIHHLDWSRAPNISYGKHKTINKMNDQEYAAYLSEPAEFNAWFQSYVDDIEKQIQFFVEKVPSEHWNESFTVADKFVSRFMRSFQADGWRIDILPAGLQRKIQKRLAQMFLHLWGDPEPKRLDVAKYLKSMDRYLWGAMEDRVEGRDFMDDPEGVAQRFDHFIGNTFEEFLTRHGTDLAGLPAGQLLGAKTGMRKLYHDLRKERDYVVTEGRRKQVGQ